MQVTHQVQHDPKQVVVFQYFMIHLLHLYQPHILLYANDSTDSQSDLKVSYETLMRHKEKHKCLLSAQITLDDYSHLFTFVHSVHVAWDIHFLSF